MASIKARRQLSELFRKGTEVRFFQGENGPEGKLGPFLDETGAPLPPNEGEVVMFIRPPDPVQRDMAMRKAQGKRAAALVRAKRNDESEEYLTIMAFLADMSDETLVDYVVIGAAGERQAEAEREILANDEWKDMLAYQDAMAEFADFTEEELEASEDWKTLLDLDEKYRTQVNEREVQLTQAHRESLRFVPREALERKALEKRAEMVGTQAFMAEYEKQMMFFAVRDGEDIDQLFFERAEDLAAQPDEVRDKINEALIPFISEAAEAKNSPGAEAGSPSSDQPSKPATTESSTPKELAG